VLLTIGVFLFLATIAATTGATIALSLSLLPAIATESGIARSNYHAGFYGDS
jgi:hypothetical protein